MKKRIKTVLTGAGIGLGGLGLFCGVCYLGTRRLMQITLDRDGVGGPSPRGAKWFSGTDLLERYGDRIAAAASALEARSFEEIRIRSRDGVELCGHWYGAGEAKRTVIAMHGWRSSWSRDFGFIADFWFENGCNVLFAEQRGQNNSGGDRIGFGILERYDCLDWIRWAEGRSGALPIYLDGISMGATTVLMASGLGLSDRVHGIIADCGFTSPHAIWKHVSEKNLHMPYGINGFFADKICRNRLNSGSRVSAADALRVCPVPVLFIHGTEDHFVPVEMTYENYQACAGPKRLFVVPGADHGMAYHVDRPGYQQAVLDFWADWDGNA